MLLAVNIGVGGQTLGIRYCISIEIEDMLKT
jgi:hypothetical protein